MEFCLPLYNLIYLKNKLLSCATPLLKETSLGSLTQNKRESYLLGLEHSELQSSYLLFVTKSSISNTSLHF